MGRPRGGTVSSSSDATSKADGKSKQIRSSTRERKELMSTYAEDSHSESDQEERDEDPGSDFKESLSESISEPESSGSEYGVKKKKGRVAKVSPKKVAKGRGRGKKASPKRKPKASPAKSKGRPGRKPKASASPSKKADRPQRSSNKRLKYKERSDSEDEESPVLTDESEEPEEQISESEEPYESGSDSGRKGRKRKAPQEKPKGRAGPAKRVAAEASAKNGKKKVKDESEEDEEEEEEEEVKEKPVKSREAKNDVGKKSEPASAAAASSESDANGEGESAEEDVVMKDAPKSTVTEDKPKKADDEDMDMDDVVDKESVKSKSDDGEKVLKNATETDYSSINFECDKKTTKGDAPNLRIACWNIGGIKSWIKKNGLEYLAKENPDVLCLQEIKSSEKTQPPEVSKIANYPHSYWSFSESAGHHGVGLISKVKPENVTYGLPIKDDDSEEDKKLKKSFNTEGRLIVAEYDKFILINAYVPNGGRAVKEGNSTKPYPPKVTSGERGHWDRLFRGYVKELDAKKPVILTGDLNVAHEEIDLANPKTNSSTAGFTKEEREGFTELLKETKLIDSFRSLYPDQKGAYSFWSYMHNSRQKNVGWRLDYFLISEKLSESLVENTMRTGVLGSDHCPIVLFLHI